MGSDGRCGGLDGTACNGGRRTAVCNGRQFRSACRQWSPADQLTLTDSKLPLATAAGSTLNCYCSRCSGLRPVRRRAKCRRPLPHGSNWYCRPVAVLRSANVAAMRQSLAFDIRDCLRICAGSVVRQANDALHDAPTSMPGRCELMDWTDLSRVGALHGPNRGRRGVFCVPRSAISGALMPQLQRAPFALSTDWPARTPCAVKLWERALRG